MNVIKTGIINYSSIRKEKTQNRFHNTLMDRYKVSLNENNKKGKKIKVILNKNNKINEVKNEVILNTEGWKTIYKRYNIRSPSEEILNQNSKINFSQNQTNNFPKRRTFFKTSFLDKNKVLKSNNRKVNHIKKKKISDNKNNKNNKSMSINSNNQFKKYTNNRDNYSNEEQFLNGQFINNSIVDNNIDIIKNYDSINDSPIFNIQLNNLTSQNSRIFSKDNPRVSNNSKLSIHNIFMTEGNNNIFDNYKLKNFSPNFSQDDVIIPIKDSLNINKKTIEVEKKHKPKKFYKNKTQNKNFEKLISYNEKQKSQNIYSKIQKRKINNLIKNSGYISDYNSKTNLVNYKIKNSSPLKYLLFSNSQVDNIRNKLDNNISQTNETFNNTDNIFFDKTKYNNEIESCIISFRNKKLNKVGQNFKKFNTYKNEINKKYIKKKILNESKSYQKYFNRNKKRLNNKENKSTNYRIYKKPNLSFSQNFISNNQKTNYIGDYCSQTHYNIYSKTENNIQSKDPLDDKIYLEKKYLITKNIYNKRLNNQNNKISFGKKSISSMSIMNNNAYNNSPVYTKKKSANILKRVHPSKLFKNIFENNGLSNTHSFINSLHKNNKIYFRVKNSNLNNLNSTYKFFNSQIINIKNNIFNNNEIPTNTPFEEETKVEPINVHKINLKKGLINSTVKNRFNFFRKYYKYYKYFSNKAKKEPKNYLYNKSILIKEKIIKKDVMPLCYYTKSNIKIFQIPKIPHFYCTKVFLSSSVEKNNKEVINYEENIKEGNENNIILNKNPIVLKKKTILKDIINRNISNNRQYETKTYGYEIMNIYDNKEYDIKTYKDERCNTDNLNLIKVKKRKIKPKNIKDINKDIFKSTNIIDKEKENECFITNKINSIMNKNNEIIYKKNKFKSEEKKSLKNSYKKLKKNYLRNQRSSSYKMKKNIDKNKDKDNVINLIKVRTPNSESRKKKYKINVVKRIKIRYKKKKDNFSEEKILINNNNNINEEQNIKKRYNSIKRNKIVKDKENKILLIIKEDLENYILFSIKNQENENILIKNNYDYSIIDQLLIKKKIDLSDLLQYYLKISFDVLDSKDKIIFANEYIQNIIENYKKRYLNKNDYIRIHEDILDMLIDIVININRNRIKSISNVENKYSFDIVGSLFYSLLINDLFFVSDLNMFINCEEKIYINIAKIVRFIIIYSNDEDAKNKYFKIFKNSRLFFNNPIYFNYVTKYLKLLNIK